ncbi:MAG: hypothetical protein JWQ04_295 [Pedosphaera sp.]|nr:hypothetical protein [Pedosphaera sp.]
MLEHQNFGNKAILAKDTETFAPDPPPFAGALG